MRPGGGNQKGAKFEQDVVRLAKDYGYTAADRTGYKQRSGKKGVKKDDPDIVGIGVLWLESKRRANGPRPDEYRVALDKERPGYVNAVVWRADRDPAPRVTLLFEDLLKLMTNPPRSREEAERSLLGDYVVDITKALRDSGLAPDGPWKQYARPSRDGEGGE